jgi:NitT/TauT family transport system substrate-binding protein
MLNSLGLRARGAAKVLGAAALVLAFLSACNNEADPGKPEANSLQVEISMQTWIGYGYAVIAADKGFYDGMTVKISQVEDGQALVGGLSGGTTPIIGTTIDQFVLLRTNDLASKLLVVTDDSYGGDGLAVMPDVKQLTDLKGKRVSYTPGPSSEYVLATALKSAGMTMDDIIPVTFPDPGDTARAFVSGQVDAAMLFQPFLQMTLERPQSRFLFTTKEFPDVSMGCFIIKDGLQNGDEIAAKFIAGVKKGEEFALANPKEADEILKRVWSITDKDLADMRSGARLKSAAENARVLDASGGEAPAMTWLRDVESYYRSRGQAGAHVINASDIYSAAAAALKSQ